MINARDPRDDRDVTKLPCRIGTGDCELIANGYCEECGKATCRSCAIEIEGGLLLCLDCEDDLQLVAEKEKRERKAA